MSRERYEELLQKRNASVTGIGSFSDEEVTEYLNLKGLYAEKEEEDTANFFEGVQKTAQNLFVSGSAGIETIGEAIGSETLDKLGERGRRFAEPSLNEGPRLKTFDDIQGVGDSMDWLFNSALPQISTSIVATLPSIYAGSKAGGALGSLLGPVGTTVGGIAGAALGAFLPSMILGTGEVAREIEARGPVDKEGKPFRDI